MSSFVLFTSVPLSVAASISHHFQHLRLSRGMTHSISSTAFFKFPATRCVHGSYHGLTSRLFSLANRGFPNHRGLQESNRRN